MKSILVKIDKYCVCIALLHSVVAGNEQRIHRKYYFFRYLTIFRLNREHLCLPTPTFLRFSLVYSEAHTGWRTSESKLVATGSIFARLQRVTRQAALSGGRAMLGKATRKAHTSRYLGV